MGGRKSYPTRRFLGGSREVNKEIKNLKSFVETGKTDKIAIQTFNVVVKSRNPITYSSYSNKLFPEIIRNYSEWSKITDLDYLKREVSKSWSKIKKQNKIYVPKEADRIIIENAVKTIGGKK